MSAHVRAILWLLVLSLLLCSVLYPLAVWGVGRAAFPDRARGSLIEVDGKPVGSRLIAQPFTKDEYFQPRPSSASYNGAASGGSNWGASNYQLRDRVARSLGPVVKYKGGPKKGQPVGPDVESWFGKDQFQGKPGIVAQWAQAHSTLAQNWVKADKQNADYVTRWQQEHAAEVEAWKKENPDTPEPKPEDLAVIFFESYSKTFPGTWPIAVEHKTPDGKTEKRIEPVKEGTDIQSVFFDLWRQEYPQADLEDVPADLVMASGSGLDPHITLKNAHYQLDRVATAWAKKVGANKDQVADAIRALLEEKKTAPLGGLAGVDLVNVLEVNLALPERVGRLSQTK
jgi:K+-transporting ATPase ATPase C chain